MHRVLQSYLQQFVQDNELSTLESSEQFEQFVNYCQVYKFYPEIFDVQEVSTSTNDDSIDGAAVLIGDDLILTIEEANLLFESVRPRQTLNVRYVFIQAKQSEGFDAGDILKFGQGVHNLLIEENYVPPDDVLQEVSAINQIVVKNLNKVENGRPDCLLYYATTGKWNEESGLRSQMKYITEQLQKTAIFNKVLFEPLDRDALIGLWNQTQKPVSATFTVQSILPLPTIDKVEEAYLAIVPAKGFIKSVLTDDDGRIRSSVFEHNVRAFLGDDNPVNSKIRKALINKDNHDQFVILNNGLTLVAPDVKAQGTRVSLTDFQIVNGCQTSHVLFRNYDALSDNVQLVVRLIETNDPDILVQVVEATNSQSNVSASQFLSIQPFVRNLERFFASFDREDDVDRRLYFERRTKQFAGQGISKYRIFDIEKLARVYAAMFLDLPHLACRYPTQTFRERSKDLFQEKHRESAYYAAALTYYRLSLAFSNNNIESKYRPYIWHILMIVKYQLAGSKIPALNSKKLDPACDKIIEPLKIGGRASLPPFQEALKIIDMAGEATRDRLKRQLYTQDLMTYLGCGNVQQNLLE